MNGKVKYSIVNIKPEDTQRVLDFLRKFFCHDEPIVEAIHLLDGPEDRCFQFEEYCVESIPEDTSRMAVDSEGRMLGVCMNAILSRDLHGQEPADFYAEADKCPHSKFRKVLRLLKRVYWESNVFKRYPQIQTALDIKILSVDPNYRCQGIGTALLEETKKMAVARHIPLLRVDCTSLYTLKAVSRLGFQTIYSLPYAEHCDAQGTPEVPTLPPHTAVNVCVYMTDCQS